MRAAAIFGTGYLPNDADRKLLERLREPARDADAAVDGGNGMGIVNGVAGFHSTFANVRPNLGPDTNVSYTGYEKEARLSASGEPGILSSGASGGYQAPAGDTVGFDLGCR